MPAIVSATPLSGQLRLGRPLGAKPDAVVAAKGQNGHDGQKRARRPYLYALDPIRVVTALSVLAVHVFEFSSVLNTSALGGDIQLGASSALHFTREVFMFTTAFVLVYTYAGASFNLKSFVRKRGLTVVVPYALWSVAYVAFNAWMHQIALPPLHFVVSSVKAVLTGSASYQLYFILLTIQFYALFPLLLRLLPWLRAHARAVLTISLVIEMAFLAFDFVFLENLHAAPVFASSWATRIGLYIDFYQDRFVLVYQFYFLLGAILALNVERVGAFLLAHGRAIVVAFVLTLIAFWLNFAFALGAGHDTVDYATAVLQPAMVPYSVVVLAFLGYLACRWAPPPRLGQTPAKPYAAQLWHTLAESTFGIYLVHPVFLTLAMAFVAPALPSAVPVPIRVALLLLIVTVGSVGASVILLRAPGLSGLVGRPSPLPTVSDLRRLLPRARAELAGAIATLSEGVQRFRSLTQHRATGAVPRLASGSAATAAPVANESSHGARVAGSDAGEDMGRTRRGTISARPLADAVGDRLGDAGGEHNGRGSREQLGASGPRSVLGRRERERRVRHARQLKQEGWRHREIAAELGVSRSTVSYWLKRCSANDGRDTSFQ